MDLIAKEYVDSEGSNDSSNEDSAAERSSLSRCSVQETNPVSVSTPSDVISHSTVGYISTRKRARNMDSSQVNDTHTMGKNSLACTNSLSSFMKESTGAWDGKSQQQQCADKPLIWRGHDKPVLSLDWHSSHPSLLLSSSLDGQVKVWNASRKGDCLVALTAPAPVQVARWVPDSSHTLNGGYDKAVNQTDMETLNVINSVKLDGVLTALALHPSDRNVFITGDSCKMVKSWDIRSGKSLSSYLGAGGQILDITLINAGKELIASSDIVRKNAACQMLLVWDYSSGIAKSRQIYCEPYTCPCVRSHPYDDVFMAQSNANYIVIFSSKPPYRMNKHKRYDHHIVNGYKTQFDVCCNGTALVSGSADGSLYVYDCHTTRLRKRHSFSVPSIAVQCHPTISSLVTCSLWDGSIATLNFI